MLRFSPILLAILYAFAMYRFSTWRTARELDAKSSPLRDRELGVLLEKMAKALDLKKIPVNIYEIEPVNGLAAPDGRIFVTRGFLNKYLKKEVSAQELASVIAHELGHVALGHSRRRMIDFSGQNAIRAALGVVLGRFLPGIGGYVANFLTTLLAARLSRQDEYEADAYASALLMKSGIGVGAQKSLFLKLDDLTQSGGRQLAWLMSHPNTGERIKAIEQREKKWRS